jgi:hypothetical protein
VSCKVLAPLGAPRAARACAAAPSWGIWCAAQAAQTHLRLCRSLSKARHRCWCCVEPGTTQCARRMNLLALQRNLRCCWCQRLQAYRRTPPLFAAVIVRDRVTECNAVARHSRMAELDAAGAAAALVGSQPAVIWCAPPLRHLFSCAAALHVSCASAARGWRGIRSRRRRCCVVLCFLECCFLGRETLGRATTAAHTLTRHL